MEISERSLDAAFNAVPDPITYVDDLSRRFAHTSYSGQMMAIAGDFRNYMRDAQ